MFTGYSHLGELCQHVLLRRLSLAGQLLKDVFCALFVSTTARCLYCACLLVSSTL